MLHPVRSRRVARDGNRRAAVRGADCRGAVVPVPPHIRPLRMRASAPPARGVPARVAATAAVLLALASARPAAAQLFPGLPRRGEPADTVRCAGAASPA